MIFQVTVNAVVLYWVTAFRPGDQAHENNLTTINFSVQFASHGAVITSSRSPLATPDLIMPAPAQDKTKPYRHTSAVVSYQERFTQQESIEGTPRPVEQYEPSHMRDLSTHYPVARIGTVETVRTEVAQRSKWTQDSWWWLRWGQRRHAMWRRGSRDGKVESGTKAPSEVCVFPSLVQIDTNTQIMTEKNM